MARATSEDPAVWLGAALPDLQREAGVPIGSLQRWGAPIRVGVESHHAVDAVFHDLPQFVAGSRSLTRDLLDRGVPRGAARAVGHAGWELLLDGLLVDDDALMADYCTALCVRVPDDAWRRALDRRAARGVPGFYADPARVAEVLQRILQDRPRLAFNAAHFAAVAAALAAARPNVAAVADEVFAAVTPTLG